MIEVCQSYSALRKISLIIFTLGGSMEKINNKIQMRLFSITIFAWLFSATPVLTQTDSLNWKFQNSGVGVNLWDVFFVDSLYGWAVGDSGTIISTSDGGGNWEKLLTLNDTVELKQIQFLDRDTGFVAGNIIISFPYFQARQTLLLRTVDGGHTWERLDSSFSKYFSFGNFQYLNPQTGWISINNGGQVNWEDRKGMLLKTTNGGSTWATLKEDSLLLCGAFYFNNEEQGYSFWASFFDNFGPSYLYCTRDEGKNWNYTGIIDNDLVKKVECHSPSVLWAIGFQTSLSINDGKDWRSWDWFTAIDSQKRTIPADFDINNSGTLFLIGNAMTSASDVEGRLLITSDAGENWSLNLQMFYTAFFGISVVGNKAWIVGSNGLILHNDDVITNVEKEPNESVNGYYIKQNYPNPFNPTTQIKYNIPKNELVVLKIYDILGKEVALLVNEEKPAGTYSVTFDALKLPSGVYLYSVNAGRFKQVKKMMLLH